MQASEQDLRDTCAACFTATCRHIILPVKLVPVMQASEQDLRDTCAACFSAMFRTKTALATGLHLDGVEVGKRPQKQALPHAARAPDEHYLSAVQREADVVDYHAFAESAPQSMHLQQRCA